MISAKKAFIVIMLAVVAVLSLVLVACMPEGSTQEDLPALKFNPNSVELYAGNSAVVQIEGLAEGETVVEWVSNDEDVATFSSSGEITAVSVGNTTVKAITDKERIALVSVVVKDSSLFVVPSLSLGMSNATLAVGDTFTFYPQLTFDGQSVVGSFVWQTTNSAVVTVADGVITAVGTGSATVVCQASFNNQTTTSSVVVSVTEGGYYFCADYEGREIWKGDEIELTVSQTINGETTPVQGVTYKSSRYAVGIIADNKFIASGGGDTVVTATFERDGVEYSCQTTVHVYGTFNVVIYSLGKRDQTIRNKMYGDKITLELKKPVANRAIKCWYVNGEPIEGNTFIMPDGAVTAYAKHVNETEGDFSLYLSDGKLLQTQPEVLFQNAVKTDSKGNTNTDGNYVLVSNGSTGGSSLQLNLDEGIVITENAYVVFRVYLSSSTVKLYFGTGNTVRSTYSADGTGFAVESNCWTDVKVPLTTFGEVNTLLNNISFGLTGSSVYIDYVMFVY